MATADASQPQSLVTYCGGYCGACWILNGKIREMSHTLQDTLQGLIKAGDPVPVEEPTALVTRVKVAA